MRITQLNNFENRLTKILFMNVSLQLYFHHTYESKLRNIFSFMLLIMLIFFPPFVRIISLLSFIFLTIDFRKKYSN